MKSKSLSSKEYERLGKLLVSIYETGYIGRKELFRVTFLKGIITGFGSVVGATIVIALLLWIISLLDRTPLVDRLIDSKKIQQTLQPTDK